MSLKLGSGELVTMVIDEIWNQGELDVADGLFTDDYVNHGGLIPDLIRGPEAIKLSVVLYRSAFPNFHLAVDGITMDKDDIVVRWVAHREPPIRHELAPREGGLRGITRLRLQEDGKISESWMVWDQRVDLMRLTAAATPTSHSPAGEQQ